MASRNQKRVLVIDGETTVCNLLDELLSQQGYQVSAITDPSQVVASIKGGAYDLMFIGLQMAKKSGVELAKVVKERSPSTSVIIMTGLDTEDIMVEMLGAGVDGVLLKPFDIDEAVALASELTRTGRSALSRVS